MCVCLSQTYRQPAAAMCVEAQQKTRDHAPATSPARPAIEQKLEK